MIKGPHPRYDALVEAGELTSDPAQEAAADRLQALHDALKTYDGPGGWPNGWFGRKAPPQGVYLWGGVGRGKTLLMDIFFNNTNFSAKRRVHFHEFMVETHERIAQWRATGEAEKRRHKAWNRAAPDDPMPPVAYDLAREAMLLCFDEFHVSDIADAMILGRLFTALFERGVIVVATSNRAPGDLYKDGLNRQLFLPFIDLLKARLDVVELAAARDYRLAKLSEAPVYYQPLGPDADRAMDAAWARMLSGGRGRRETVAVKGRALTVPMAARGAARFSFADLCEQPLGAADYLALTRRYGALFIDRIPVMRPDMRNEAKRFSTLIDTIYDARVKLVCSADAEPNALYPAGDGAFEFERTASRLIEMRSADYLASASVAGPEPAS
jgi:cell division protein ZapE